MPVFGYNKNNKSHSRNYILKEDRKPLDSYRLADLVKYLQLDEDRDFRPHDALEDSRSRMAGRLYIKCNEIARVKVEEEMQKFDYVNRRKMII